MMTNQDFSEGDEVRSIFRAWILRGSVGSLLTMANKDNCLIWRMAVSGSDPAMK